MHPHTGGSYRRETDGSLTRIDAPADAGTETPAEDPAASELAVEQPAVTETPRSDDVSGRKGKA